MWWGRTLEKFPWENVMVRLSGSSQHQSLHWEVREVEELAVVTENPLKELWRNPLAEFLLLQWERSWPSTQLLPVLLAEKMMVTIQKHEVANTPSENTVYSWKVIKRTIKTQPNQSPNKPPCQSTGLSFQDLSSLPAAQSPYSLLVKFFVGLVNPSPSPVFKPRNLG